MATAVDQGRGRQHFDSGEWNTFPDELAQVQQHFHGTPEDIEHAFRYLWLDGDFAPRLVHQATEIRWSEPRLGEKLVRCSKTGYWAAAKDIVKVDGRPVIKAFAPTTFRRGARRPNWLE